MCGLQDAKHVTNFKFEFHLGGRLALYINGIAGAEKAVLLRDMQRWPLCKCKCHATFAPATCWLGAAQSALLMGPRAPVNVTQHSALRCRLHMTLTQISSAKADEPTRVRRSHIHDCVLR